MKRKDMIIMASGGRTTTTTRITTTTTTIKNDKKQTYDTVPKTERKITYLFPASALKEWNFRTSFCDA